MIEFSEVRSGMNPLCYDIQGVEAGRIRFAKGRIWTNIK